MVRRFLTAFALAVALVAPPGAAVSSAAAADLDWQPCDLGAEWGVSGFECSTIDVPMAHDAPADGQVFTLALARHVSTGTPQQRIGSLFYNPGGPGGSGLGAIPAAWLSLPDAVRERFDLVSWDPRGVGATTPAPVACSTETDEPVAPPTGSVDLVDVARRAIAQQSAILSTCEIANRAIVGHLGTNEVVEDLDDLRAAVGDDRLTYWGVSYGTEIGYAYAAAHPDRVRAILLDSPMDPTPWTDRRVAESVRATESAYAEFARLHPDSAAQFDRVVRHLSRLPVRLTDNRTLDRWSAAQPVRLLVSFQSGYQKVVQLIELMKEATLGTVAERAIARPRLDRWLDVLEGLWASSDAWVRTAIFCSDTTARPALDEVLSIARQLRRTVSVQAAVEAAIWASMCHGLRQAPDPVLTLTAGAGPAVPLLVIGSTHDGRTNGAWVPRMTAAFPSARSITYQGGQHGLFGAVDSGCVDARVTRYLLTTALPARDVRCPSTYQPGGLVD